ncbi:MAG: GxxExxY protein [Myxococcales bacterium]|nr:GxxExxY protein [Myxococcales bacterium]
MALHDEEITEAIIGAAIEVHRHLGPGLLESAYRRCLAHELELRGVEVATEMPVDLRYKRLEIAASYRIDLLVADRVMVEAKTVDQITPLHEAQLLTYLRLSGRKSGLLLNFKVRLLKDGIVRRVLQQPPLNHPRPATPLSVLPSVSSVTPWWFVASLRSLPPSPQPSPPIGEREGGSPSPCGQRG